jgi:hypothetical protein
MTMPSSDKPKRIYKYQPYSLQSLDNLQKRVLWFSDVHRFNDPFDCTLREEITPNDLTEEDWKAAYDRLRSEAEGENRLEEYERKYLTNGRPNREFRGMLFERAMKNEKGFAETAVKQYGLACFSAKSDDILMWAHYAAGHSGFCLEYDTSYPPFDKLFPVRYHDTMPIVGLKQLLGIRSEELFSILVETKYTCWAYEEEWRVIHDQADKAYEVDRKALTAVYFGCTMPKVHQQIVALIVQDSPTQLHVMAKDDSRFAVRAQPAAPFGLQNAPWARLLVDCPGP